MMRITIEVGDVLKFKADVLISTANPWLNLSGGVNGAILTSCGPAIQRELHAHLKQIGTSAVPAGTVVRSDPASLPFKHILHAVAIDPFYDSSIELVRSTLTKALEMAVDLGATSVASPTLATGYGPLNVRDFGECLVPLVNNPRFASLSVIIVVRCEDDAATLNAVIN